MGRQPGGGAGDRRRRALLARAEFVEIVAANAAVLSQPVVNGGERIARRFARLGVDASFRRLPGDGDPANLLLSTPPIPAPT